MMKLAISNIAWEQHDDPKILKMLSKNNISGIEVAPTKIWPDWRNALYKNATKYKKMMNDLGFQIPSLQAILFGKNNLQIFNQSSHKELLDHFKRVSELAAGLGSHVLVFGSPKNRKRGQILYNDALKIAQDFFYSASEVCQEFNCQIGLEHNPVEYGCDFITNALDAKELVEKVDHPCFKLHLDSAGIFMCGGEISTIIKNVKNFIHYHISEVGLAPICEATFDQTNGIKALKSIYYQNWVSIEMKQPSSIELLENSIKYVNRCIKEANNEKTG